jgi:hypothetical protein
MFYLKTLELYSPIFDNSCQHIVDWEFIVYDYISHSHTKLMNEFNELKAHFSECNYMMHTHYLNVFDTWEEVLDFTKNHTLPSKPCWV